MTKKPTITEVARLAGVCIGTVSRVINNKDKVNPETREKILAVIEKTGYRPSAMARGLVLSRTHNILLCMPNIADPYCASVAKLVGSRARKRGYGLLLGDSNYDTSLEAEYLQRARDGKIDGLIISPLPGTKNVRHYAELVKADFPLVVMDVVVPTLDLNCVKYDDVAIGRMATDYLISKGHRRIAFIEWQQKFATVMDRYHGYAVSHAAHGIKVSTELLVQGPEALGEWSTATFSPLFQLEKPPTAIVAENEIVGNLCINMLLRLKKRVPKDVAVVAMGDLLADSFVPVPMTAIALHHEEAVRRALDLLLELIEQPESRRKPPCLIVQTPELFVRESA